MKLPKSNKAGDKRKYLLLKLADFSKRHVAVFAVIFGAIGGIVLLNNSSAGHPTPSVYLTPETKTVAQGDDLIVEVHADSGAVKVNAVEAKFTYPADLLECVTPIDATGSAFGTAAPSPCKDGTVDINRAAAIDDNTSQPVDISGDVLVAKVKFKVKATTGSAALAFVEGTQLLDAASSTDILGSLNATVGANFTIGDGGSTTPPPTTPPPTTPPPTTPGPRPTPSVYLTPETKTVAQNDDLIVEVHADSGSVKVNAVEAKFTYPADLLECVTPIDVTGSAFGTSAPSPCKDGTVDINRAAAIDDNTSKPVDISGDVLVAKVKFKVKAATGTAALTFVEGTQLLDSASSADILGALTATRGATYTIGSTTTPPPTTPPPTTPPGGGPKVGDLNADGKVDSQDLDIFLLKWSSSDANADFDKDGTVTVYDLSILLSNYGS